MTLGSTGPLDNYGRIHQHQIAEVIAQVVDDSEMNHIGRSIRDFDADVVHFVFATTILRNLGTGLVNWDAAVSGVDIITDGVARLVADGTNRNVSIL
jgi:hypothetical protein